MKSSIKNPNTPYLWDKLLFTRDSELKQSPYYIDKIHMVYRFLKKRKGNLLDIGFGMGNLERLLASNNPYINIFGTDFSKRAVRYARKKLVGKYYNANAIKLPFKKNYFDFVTMLDVYEHIAKVNSNKVLCEISRVIKPNGYFIISVPLNENLKQMNKEGKNYNAHVRQFVGSDLKKELEDFDFSIVKEKYIYAFRRFYLIKKIVISIFPNYRVPNLLVLFTRKSK